MDKGALSKRTWEILDLEHDGRAMMEAGADPPAVVGWRLDQLEAALTEADEIERTQAQGRVARRVAEATKDIEDTVAEIDHALARAPNMYDWMARWGGALAITVAVLAGFLALRYPGFVAFFSIPALVLAMRATDEGRDARERMLHQDALPIRLRLAWDKLAAAEAELHGTGARGNRSN
jgi:hypothetical protein